MMKVISKLELDKSFDSRIRIKVDKVVDNLEKNKVDLDTAYDEVVAEVRKLVLKAYRLGAKYGNQEATESDL
jgi:hypothetical protein